MLQNSTDRTATYLHEHSEAQRCGGESKLTSLRLHSPCSPINPLHYQLFEKHSAKSYEHTTPMVFRSNLEPAIPKSCLAAPLKGLRRVASTPRWLERLLALAGETPKPTCLFLCDPRKTPIDYDGLNHEPCAQVHLHASGTATMKVKKACSRVSRQSSTSAVLQSRG